MPDTPSSSSATSTWPPELPYRLKINATGHGFIEVAGIDLSDRVRAVAFDARPASVSRLVLELIGDTELEGLAQVTVIRPAVDGLADIDPDELEAEALRRMDSFDDRSLTAVMLQVLSERLGCG